MKLRSKSVCTKSRKKVLKKYVRHDQSSIDWETIDGWRETTCDDIEHSRFLLHRNLVCLSNFWGAPQVVHYAPQIDALIAWSRSPLRRSHHHNETIMASVAAPNFIMWVLCRSKKLVAAPNFIMWVLCRSNNNIILLVSTVYLHSYITPFCFIICVTFSFSRIKKDARDKQGCMED